MKSHIPEVILEIGIKIPVRIKVFRSTTKKPFVFAKINKTICLDKAEAEAYFKIHFDRQWSELEQALRRNLAAKEKLS